MTSISRTTTATFTESHIERRSMQMSQKVASSVWKSPWSTQTTLSASHHQRLKVGPNWSLKSIRSSLRRTLSSNLCSILVQLTLQQCHSWACGSRFLHLPIMRIVMIRAFSCIRTPISKTGPGMKIKVCLTGTEWLVHTLLLATNSFRKKTTSQPTSWASPSTAWTNSCWLVKGSTQTIQNNWRSLFY